MFVVFVEAGSVGDSNAVGLEKNINDVRTDVTISEEESPGLLRSRMYQRAGLTSARVRVN